jgi:hypothetical protein
MYGNTEILRQTSADVKVWKIPLPGYEDYRKTPAGGFEDACDFSPG